MAYTYRDIKLIVGNLTDDLLENSGAGFTAGFLESALVEAILHCPEEVQSKIIASFHDKMEFTSKITDDMIYDNEES